MSQIQRIMKAIKSLISLETAMIQRAKDAVKIILYLLGFKQKKKFKNTKLKVSRNFKIFLKSSLNKLTISQNKLLLKINKSERLEYFIFMRLAYLYSQKNNFTDSSTYWGKALLLNKDNKYNDALLRKVFYILSKNDKIDSFLEKLRKKTDEQTIIYFSALIAVMKRNNIQAITAFKRIIDTKRKYVYKDSLFRLLILMEKEKRDVDFWNYFQVYNELTPVKDTVHYIQSRYFYNRNMYDECILVSKYLLHSQRYRNHAYRYIVNSLIITLRYDEAIEYLSSNEYNVEQYYIEHLYGVYYFYRLNYSEAAHYFQKSITSHSGKNNLSIHWLAKTYKNDQKLVHVKRIFDKYKNYPEEDIFTLNLAKSAGELIFIEDRLKEHMNQDKFNFELTEWFVRYLLLNRYWGRAYSLVIQKSIHEYASDFLKKTKQELEEKFQHVNIDIQQDIKQNKEIDNYMSSELIVDEILRKSKKVPRKKIVSKKIKRIALVLTSLGPGGAERQCVNLLNGFIQKIRSGEIEDVKLFVTSLSRSDRESFYLNQVLDKSKVIEFYDRKKVIGIDEVPVLEKFNMLIPLMQPLTRQQALIYLAEHLDNFSPDVIHGFQNEAILNSFLVGSMIGTPFLFGRWGSMPPMIKRNLTVMQKRNVDYMHWAYRSLERELDNKIFSTNSQMAARAYEDWIGADMLSVQTIYNGLNFEKLQVTSNSIEVKKILGLDENTIIVGSVLRVSDEKRPFLWADIAKEVNEQYHKRIHFVLVGDGPLLEELEAYVGHHGLTEFIHLVGRHDDVANWYNIMDVFLLTSAVEGIANAMLEAEYMGIPVVVPNVGGLQEALVDGVTGYILSDDSKESFTTAILELIKMDWTEENRIFSRKYIEEKFSIARMIEQTLSFYHKNIEKI